VDGTKNSFANLFLCKDKYQGKEKNNTDLSLRGGDFLGK